VTAFIQFVKFGIVGFSNTAVSYIVFSALIYIGQHYFVANAAAFILGVLNSFFWNNRYVFKRGDGKKRNIRGALLKTYLSYAFTGLLLNSALLYVFVDLLNISKYLAPLLCLPVTIPLNFVINKTWAFKD
jgi:putative flippase GtrA